MIRKTITTVLAAAAASFALGTAPANADGACAGIGEPMIPGVPACGPAYQPLADGYEVTFDNLNRWIRVETAAGTGTYVVKFDGKRVASGTYEGLAFEARRLRVGSVHTLVLKRDGEVITRVRLVPTKFCFPGECA